MIIAAVQRVLLGNKSERVVLAKINSLERCFALKVLTRDVLVPGYFK